MNKQILALRGKRVIPSPGCHQIGLLSAGVHMASLSPLSATRGNTDRVFHIFK